MEFSNTGQQSEKPRVTKVAFAKDFGRLGMKSFFQFRVVLPSASLCASVQLPIKEKKAKNNIFSRFGKTFI